MHHDVRAPQLRDGGEHIRVQLPGGDVVDDVRAGGDAGAGDGGVVGVDAEDEGVEFGEGPDVLDGWQDAGEFVGGGDGRCVRAGGFAADVEDGDGVGEEGAEGREEGGGGEGGVVQAIGGERVGGQV